METKECLQKDEAGSSKKNFGIPFSFSAQATRDPDGLAVGVFVVVVVVAVLVAAVAAAVVMIYKSACLVPAIVGLEAIANPLQPATGCYCLGFGY